MNRPVVIWAALWMASLAVTLEAQVEVERFQRQMEEIQREQRTLIDPDVPVDQRTLIDYGGFVSFNFLAIDDIDQKTNILRQTDLNGYLRVNLDGAHEFFLRARTSYRDWNSDVAIDNQGDDWVEPTLDRGTYRFDLQRYMAAYEGEIIPGNIVIQGGRQLVHWANGLTLSYEVDGAIVRFSHNKVGLDVMAGITRDSSTDIDSSRPRFSSETNRNFYGGLLTFQVDARHRPFAYGIVQRDNNPSDSLVSSGGAITTEFEYNSSYIGFGSLGSFGDRLVYGLEFVFQGGDNLTNSFNPTTGANVPQVTEDIQAFAMDLRLDYLFGDDSRTRVGVELLYATGDEDRLHSTNTFGGNRAGTKDHGFNAFGLVNTGLAFNPAFSNLLIVRTGASSFPFPNSALFGRMQVGVDVFVFNKAESGGPIDEVTTDGTYLGWEPDFYINWQLTSDVSWAIRYGVFFPGDTIDVDHDARHFFFSGLTVAF